MQRHFRVSPPSVHQMVLTLERVGLIRRQPGVPHSIELLVAPQAATTPGGSPAGLSSQHWENCFFKSVLSRDVAFGMERTRHQLAPAMPGQKIVDRAVAVSCPMAFS